ncbi:MAG: anthranilate phosphoribosyltransferase [Bacteroides sp. SM23_62_1]|nr:MAG: anthranilate phosphoribosyltransferase [Bacteroides sp. SM23_62_1]
MKNILNYLYEHKILTKEEAKQVLTNIAKGLYNHSQIASFISVYLMRSITLQELSGFRDALLDLCIPVNLSDYDTIDVCGTGGDAKDTFNISTITTFIVAGAGAKVAKHGNYAVSSTCGSSNIMEHIGYKFSNDEDKLRREIELAGVCFLHAPLFNPAMKNVAPVRRELGVKTFFNMLGPLVNPASPKKQMAGVYSLELARLYSYMFQQLEKDFVIIHSLDGYDEVSLTGECKIITRDLEQILNPADLGLKKCLPGELAGGKTVAEAADIFIHVLENTGTPAQHDIAIANAGLALKAYFPGKNIPECIDGARESLESGKALHSLKRLIELNK